QGGTRTHAGDLHELTKGLPLCFCAETEKQMHVLAHDEVGMERDLSTNGGQVVERAHRHVNLITDALHVDEHQRWKLFQQQAGYSADHTRRPRFIRYPAVEIPPRPSPPWAWQIAQARA